MTILETAHHLYTHIEGEDSLTYAPVDGVYHPPTSVISCACHPLQSLLLAAYLDLIHAELCGTRSVRNPCQPEMQLLHLTLEAAPATIDTPLFKHQNQFTLKIEQCRALVLHDPSSVHIFRAYGGLLQGLRQVHFTFREKEITRVSDLK